MHLLMHSNSKKKKKQFYALIRAFSKNKKWKVKLYEFSNHHAFIKQKWKIYMSYMYFHHAFIYASS